jgi:hypothetical protein
MPEGMQVSFAAATLPALDALHSDLLVLGCFEDDRPMHGLGSLLDWRLNGWISRLIQRNRYVGVFGEQLLFPAGHRVGPSRVLLFGLGPQGEFDEARLSEALETIWAVLNRLRLRELAFAVPAAPRTSLPKRRFLPLLTSGARRHMESGRELSLLKVTVVAPPDELKLLQSSIEPERGRSNSDS